MRDMLNGIGKLILGLIVIQFLIQLSSYEPREGDSIEKVVARSARKSLHDMREGWQDFDRDTIPKDSI
jgi:hypothetical protein